MAELASKFNIGCVIQYYSGQWLQLKRKLPGKKHTSRQSRSICVNVSSTLFKVVNNIKHNFAKFFTLIG